MEIDIQKNKKEVVELLRSTDREGIEYLIRYMENNDFFKAPCSGQYHLCCIGGLAQHSLNVYAHIKKLAAVLCDETNRPSEDTLIIVALLHDLGKTGMYNKPNYVDNWIKDGRPTKAEPEQKYKISETKPFKTNPDLLYVPHSIRSVEIAEAIIDLTEEEAFAIIYHDGLYGDLKQVINGHETLLYFLLHTADMFCSRFIEAEERGEADV